ncbi:diguanylate cyclase [Shewanella sp. AS1]|uniref:sensor domain-containing diguanylate cyclase n=1 Tax=Shewanella sp. AS1 TaxID=2907626 RepID=UPI001F233845|nr:diguanylate cyclase [Shewanella sp. AS1]MCE9679464.1 diguanylate cyclase [Shewanella sp. AS1]
MPLIKPQSLAFAFLLGLGGLLVNLAPIPLFATQQVVIGNLFFVISAIFLGPWYALLTAIMCAIGLDFAWDSWHMYLFFPLEALFLGFARRKEIYALYADMLFWVFLGMPLFYLFASVSFDLPDSHLMFITLKQGINGLLYCSLGSILVTLTPLKLQFKGGLTHKIGKNFNKQLTYTFIQILTLVLLTSTLIFNGHTIAQQQIEVQHNLKDSAYFLGESTQSYIDNHVKAIDNAARWLSLTGANLVDLQSHLFRLHQNYPYFTSLLIIDSQGESSAHSQRSHSTNSSSQAENAAIDVRRRPYFQRAFEEQTTYISSVFEGEELSPTPTVAISAPVYDADDHSTPIGIIVGSLNLNNFTQIDIRDPDHNQRSIVLVDSNNNVVYASSPLGISTMTPFTATTEGLRYKTSLAMMNLKQLNSTTPEFAYYKYQLKNGWSLYVVMPFSPLIRQIEQQYLITFTVLVFAFATTIFLISAVSRRLTEPLELIAQKFSDWDISTRGEILVDDSSPIEIQTLATTIQQGKQALISHQLELEEKVALRTLELKNANAKLQSLAERDELTQLYNRRYTESHFTTLHDMCKRNHAALAFCILDIDHFKRVNDTFGHQAGDKVLIALGEMMRSFFKRNTDLVSRYGGEEFVIVLPQCHAEEIQSLLDQFRQKVANTDVQVTKDNTTRVTVCIGAVVSYPGEYNQVDHWFKMADLNLYKAKAEGRNQVITTVLTEEKSLP